MDKQSNIVLFSCLLSASLMLTAPSNAADTTGVLHILWGDPDNLQNSGEIRYLLYDDRSGEQYSLAISDQIVQGAGGLATLSGAMVSVETNTPFNPQPNGNLPLQVSSLEVLSTAQTEGALNLSTKALSSSGSLVYVSIMCKYNGNPVELQNLSYFQQMYGDFPGGLDHFWKEVSGDALTIAGSTAYGWYSLPKTRSQYLSQSGTLLASLWTDCVAAADDDIDFSTVYGINLMFNDEIDGFSWGGQFGATLDGVNNSWSSTWEPPWGWANVGIMAHEMGHSLGLPHSNNYDADNDPYDNPWTPMSDAQTYKLVDPVYGTRGAHLNAFEKSELDWLHSEHVFTGTSSFSTVNVDAINSAQPEPGHYLAVIVPAASVSAVDYYTVEARANGVGGGEYDSELPGTAVLIYSVVRGRREPSWLVDADVPPSEYASGEGVMWRVGEVFEDTAAGVRISIDAQTATGFTVSIGYEPNLECNGLSVTVDISSGDIATSGDDVILGTPGDDTISAFGGNDTICGLGGDDVIFAGNGDDWVDAGAGNDVVQGSNGTDVIFGGEGDDYLAGGPGDDTVNGEEGNDSLFGNRGADTINGGQGVDEIRGGPGDDDIDTGSGGTVGSGVYVDGGAGDDTIIGGPDADEIRGSTDQDTVIGGDGDDMLYGGSGEDEIRGDAGDDLIRGNAGNDVMTGGSGNDNINGYGSGDTITGGEGDDTLDGSTGNDVIRGEAGDDTIRGGGGNDQLFGDAGVDNLVGGGGNDAMDGGSGAPDVCDGQNGDDTAAPSCENVLNTP